MGAVIRDPRTFECACSLRVFAARESLPAGTLLQGCGAAAEALSAGKSVAEAVAAGQTRMRQLQQPAVPAGGAA
jgi:hypothetical protein